MLNKDPFRKSRSKTDGSKMHILLYVIQFVHLLEQYTQIIAPTKGTLLVTYSYEC
jgi:hypothetical protein